MGGVSELVLGILGFSFRQRVFGSRLGGRSVLPRFGSFYLYPKL